MAHPREANGPPAGGDGDRVVLAPESVFDDSSEANFVEERTLSPQQIAASLESLADRHRILPWTPARTSTSLEAENLVRRLGRTPREHHPWIPISTIGPLLIVGHYNPAATELWGIPDFLVVRTVVSTDKYRQLHDDLIERMKLNPVSEENACEFMPGPEAGSSLLEVFHWYIENYPLEKVDTDRLAMQMGKVKQDQLEEAEQFNEIDRNLGTALYRIATGNLVFNPEEAPPQTAFSDTLLEKHEVYPLFSGRDHIYLITANPSDYAFEDEWLSAGNEPVPIRMVVGDRAAIKRTISRHRCRQSDSDARQNIQASDLDFAENANLVEIEPSDVEQINPANINTTPEEILHWILYRSIMNRASDLHVERYYNMCRFRARIDGKLRVIYSCPDENLTRFVALFKNYANMAQSRQEAQDARFSMALGKRRVDVRVAAVPCRKELQKLTMRFLDKQDGLKSLGDLNLSERQSAIVEDVMGRDQGLVLITGPTGSGKTTTLYALINSVNSEDRNIHTIEDPIEYEIEGINQTQTDPFHNIDFAAGLRALLRSDPDVILIGESRDEETAQAAVNAALTGHLVLTTLHANDCIRAVTRLLSMGVPPYLLADSIAMSQAQRLVRRLCTYCKRPIGASSDFQRLLAKQGLIQAPLTNPIYEGNGCSECFNSGFLGRIALMEMCLATHRLQDLIAKGAPQSEMRALVMQSGVLTLYQEGLMQVVQGSTTLKEVGPLSYTSEMSE